MKLCKPSDFCRTHLLGLALVAGLVVAPNASHGQTIPNPSFELDNFTNGSGYISENFAITGWTGSPAEQVGINPAGGASPFANNGAIPAGGKVAFIQSTPTVPGVLGTVITGLTPGQKYTVNFRLNARTNSPAQTPFLKIGIDGQPIVNISTLGVQIGGTTTAYRYAAFDFSAAGTTAALSLTNDATATASTVLVDDFSINVSTNGWSYAAWTGDADAGVNTTNATHAYNFGGTAAPDTTINGVLFKGVVGANPASANEFSITGLGSQYTSDDVNNITTGGSAALAKRFTYGGNPGYFFIAGLAPGKEYVANFYTCAWETGMRAQTFAHGTDRLTVNQDQFDNNNGIRISYRYIASTNGSILLTQTPLLPANTLHLYGFANYEANPQPMPEIGMQPRSQVTTPGSLATFSITAAGQRPFAYQWLKDGAPLAGLTDRFLTVSNIAAGDLGGYAAVVSNASGSVTSQVATLTFGPIANPGFEADVFRTWPGYASGNKPISGWYVFNPGRAGVNPLPEYPGPFANSGAIPEGSQVAFLQNTNWMSTMLYGLTPGQKYTLTFRGSARSGQLPTLHAAVDGQLILDFKLGAAAGTNAYRYIAFDFTPATSSPTLYLTNDTYADQSALFDDFRIAPSTTHWSFSTWADDASSGVDPSRNYSHAYNFGTASNATINGVIFKGAPGANPAGRGFVATGFPSIYTGDVNNITAAGGGSATLMKDFIYNGLPESLTITGLVPYVEYEATIYSVGWSDTNGYGRAATFSVGTDLQTMDQDHFGTDAGIKFSYRYVADASGSIVLNMDATHNAGGSISTIHTYGFSNYELSSTNVPVFYQQPLSRTISGGANVSFFTAVGGAQPISLQWRKDGADIPGEAGLTLTLPNVDGTATGDYTLVASNAVGVVTSAVARLEVGLAMVNPSFEVDTFFISPGYIDLNFPITGWTASLTAQTGINPAAGSPFANNGVIPDGNQVAFIQADGGVLSQVISGLVVGRTYYLKYFENSRSGYNAPTLAVTLGETNIVPAHVVPSGAYTRVVSGPFMASTDSAELAFIKTASPLGGDSTVLIDSIAVLELPPTPPTVLVQPQGLYLKEGEAGALYAIVQGTLPMTFQWQHDEADIAGATSDTWSFPSLAFSDAGLSRLIASNSLGSVTSQVAVVKVGLAIPELFNTGVDSTGALVGGGMVDPHYQLIDSSDTIYTGPKTWTQLDQYPIDGTHWMANGPLSMWIAPRVNEIGYSGNASGNYTYRTWFILDSLDPATAEIRGQWSLDNAGWDIMLNGVSLGITNSTGFTRWSTFVITNGFVAGSNRLDLVVTNAGVGATALRVELSGLAQPLPPAAPQIVAQPVDTLASESQEASFAVLATGSPLAYQWFHDGSLLPGETSRILRLYPVDVSQAGYYSVVVSNSLASQTSSNALLVVNRAPTATDDFIATEANRAVTIAFSKLLFNDTDPDGDAISVTGVDAASIAGGSVTLSGASLTYTPPNGFTGQDQFMSYSATAAAEPRPGGCMSQWARPTSLAW